MIGNDIIDLKIVKAEKKSENIRFLKKIFTEKEREIIKTSSNPENTLWLLWSMKETAYKAHQRIFSLAPQINPLAFECSPDIYSNIGAVITGEFSYPVRFEPNSEYIYSQTNSSRTFRKIYNLKKAQSKFIKEIALIFKSKSDEIQIQKDEYGIPLLKFKNTSKKLPISISHHGDFSAFVIPLINS